MIIHSIHLGGDWPFSKRVRVKRADLKTNYRDRCSSPFKWVANDEYCSNGAPCIAIDGPFWDLLESGLGMREGAFACRKCGHIELGNYLDEIKDRLRKIGFCHTCDFWLGKAKLRRKSNKLAVIDGKAYWIEPDAPKGFQGFVGHGGAAFEIRFLDGRVVQSRNLWFNGDVPECWRAFLPDNAVFSKLDRSRLPGHDAFTGGAA